MVCVRLELQNDRCATSSKLRKEWERRIQGNIRAVGILEEHRELWCTIGGPDPKQFYLPSRPLLDCAQVTMNTLRRISFGGDSNLEAFAEEIEKAVNEIKLVEWQAIRTERFSLTPEALFDDLVRIAQSLLNNSDGELARRRARLAECHAEAEDINDTPLLVECSPQIRPLDKYGLDLDEFKGQGTCSISSFLI